MKQFVAIATLALVSFVAGEFRATSLNVHNQLRAKHANTPSMTQDADLNNRAQQCAQHYANKGRIDHSCKLKNGAGENLYQAGGGNGDADTHVRNGANVFYNEIKDYNYNRPGYSDATGHFTQLVWVKSTKLGTGYVKKGNSHFVVNLYREAGNMQNKGEFEKNVQRPK